MKLSNRLSSLAISSLLSVVVFCIGMSSVNAREFNNEDNKIVAVIVNLFEDAHNDDFNQESYTNKENITLQFTTNDDQKISAKLVICDMPSLKSFNFLQYPGLRDWRSVLNKLELHKCGITKFDIADTSFAGYSITSLSVCGDELDQIVDSGKQCFLKSLERLNFSSNNVATLGSIFAQETFPNLKELNLSNNRIYKIEENAFQGLHNLTVLNLANNLLDDESLNRNAFFGVGNKTRELSLILDQNYFKQIPPSIACLKKCLAHLSLENCEISSCITFPCKMNFLKEVNLKDIRRPAFFDPQTNTPNIKQNLRTDCVIHTKQNLKRDRAESNLSMGTTLADEE